MNQSAQKQLSGLRRRMTKAIVLVDELVDTRHQIDAPRTDTSGVLSVGELNASSVSLVGHNLMAPIPIDAADIQPQESFRLLHDEASS